MKLGLLTPVLALSPGKHAPWELDEPSAVRQQEIVDAAVRLRHDNGFAGTSGMR
jgi:hypothetical protein